MSPAKFQMHTFRGRLCEERSSSTKVQGRNAKKEQLTGEALIESLHNQANIKVQLEEIQKRVVNVTEGFGPPPKFADAFDDDLDRAVSSSSSATSAGAVGIHHGKDTWGQKGDKLNATQQAKHSLEQLGHLLAGLEGTDEARDSILETLRDFFNGSKRTGNKMNEEMRELSLSQTKNDTSLGNVDQLVQKMVLSANKAKKTLGTLFSSAITEVATVTMKQAKEKGVSWAVRLCLCVESRISVFCPKPKILTRADLTRTCMVSFLSLPFLLPLLSRLDCTVCRW